MLCVNLDPNEVVLIFFKHKKIRHFVLQFTSAGPLTQNMTRHYSPQESPDNFARQVRIDQHQQQQQLLFDTVQI